jgi:hypothetical protein
MLDPPRQPKSKPANGDAACGNDAACIPNGPRAREAEVPFLRVIAGEWAYDLRGESRT